MTERTVTVPTETEETITLCDECGLSDDAGEIVTYKVSQADSNGVENVRDYEALHLHTSCLEEMGVDVPDGVTYAEAAPKRNDLDGVVTVALDSVERNMLLFGVLLAFASGGLFGLNMLIAAVAVGGLGGITISGAIVGGIERADLTVEELKQ